MQTQIAAFYGDWGRNPFFRPHSTYLVQGTTAPVYPQRGLRQGDALPTLLYIFSLQPFIDAASVAEITCRGSSFRWPAHADDVCMVGNQSATAYLHAKEMYMKAAGAIISQSKSFVLLLKSEPDVGDWSRLGKVRGRGVC